MAVTIKTIKPKRLPFDTLRYSGFASYEVWAEGRFIQGFRYKRDATRFANELRRKRRK